MYRWWMDGWILIDANHEWISRSQTTCWGRESRSCSAVTESVWTWITFTNMSDGVNAIHILSRSKNHVCEREWLLLCSKITWCYADVSNTALILAVLLLNVNQLLCDSSLFAAGSWNDERITARTSITSSQFSEWVAAVPLPAGMIAAKLNWTEKGTNQTRSCPTQH